MVAQGERTTLNPEPPGFAFDFDRWRASGFVRDPEDPSHFVPVTIRQLTDDELLPLHRLHRLVVARLPHPHVLRPDNEEFMRRNLSERGITFGVFRDSDLIAYSVVAFPTADEPCPSHDLPGIRFSRDEVAIYDGSGVHPDYRKNQLHATLNVLRKEYARRHGRHYLYGTVSIYNHLSLENHLSAGLRVKNITLKYGGMVRLIIHQDTRAVLVAVSGTERMVRLVDVEEHRAALAEEMFGYEVVAEGGEYNLMYARFQAAPSGGGNP
jgi:hypothetical protein